MDSNGHKHIPHRETPKFKAPVHVNYGFGKLKNCTQELTSTRAVSKVALKCSKNTKRGAGTKQDWQNVNHRSQVHKGSVYNFLYLCVFEDFYERGEKKCFILLIEAT